MLLGLYRMPWHSAQRHTDIFRHNNIGVDVLISEGIAQATRAKQRFPVV